MLWCGFDPWPYAMGAAGKKKVYMSRISEFVDKSPPSLPFFLLSFLRLHLWHMEVPRPGVESKLQLPAYTTAMANVGSEPHQQPTTTAHGNAGSSTH